MKWLFAAAAAVCLFACGGPQDQMDKAEVHGGEVLCSGKNPDGSACTSTSCGDTCTKNWAVGNWCWSGATVSIGYSGEGVVTAADPNTTCYKVGDIAFSNLNPSGDRVTGTFMFAGWADYASRRCAPPAYATYVAPGGFYETGTAPFDWLNTGIAWQRCG